MNNLKIKGIASSFVCKDMKLKTDKEMRESELFIGSVENEIVYDSFFEFEHEFVYTFDMINILEYLQQIKIECVYQTIHQYKNAGLEKWNEIYLEVSEMEDDEFCISLSKIIDENGYYITAKERMFQKLFRKLILPEITDIDFEKDEIKRIITIKLSVNYESPKDLNIELEENKKTEVRYYTGFISEFPRNRILFGAPGTGKSYRLKQELDTLLKNGGEYERVTFHLDYSYANFVGTYKPIPTKDGISYEFIPGPFIRLYVKALQNSRTLNPMPYVLIVEEINRANVSAVFGDMFQLLDRDFEEKSEYSIYASEDLKNYLAKPEVLGGSSSDYETICLPDNMFLWATMNSADQGVFPMDTAFKRRWDFTYLSINHNESEIEHYHFQLKNGTIVCWNVLRKAINHRLASLRINEDKFMGTFFLSKKVLEGGDEVFIKAFKNKVLMYLFEDAGRHRRYDIFRNYQDTEENVILYSVLCENFDKYGVEIFCDEVVKFL